MKSFESSKRKSKEHSELRDKLQQTFIDIFLTIISRIQESKELQMVDLKQGGFTNIPKLTKVSTMLDSNYGELIIQKGLNQIFRRFKDLLEDFIMIEKNIDLKLKQED